jgi:hypothetical protein
MGEVNSVKPFFTHPNSKKPIFQDRPTRPPVEPKLEIVKTITGQWGQVPYCVVRNERE